MEIQVGIMSIFGGFMILSAIVLAIRNLRIAKKGFSSLATIIDYEESRGDENIRYNPIIKIILPSGDEHIETLELDWEKKRSTKNLKVIHFENGKQKKTILDSFKGRYLGPFLFLVCGTLLILLEQLVVVQQASETPISMWISEQCANQGLPSLYSLMNSTPIL